MARGHVFLIVVLLAAAAVAALLAVTRTAAQATPAPGSDSSIAFRLERLDRLEARLEQQLARRSASSAGAPDIVYVRPPTPLARATSNDEGDDHGEPHAEDRDD